MCVCRPTFPESERAALTSRKNKRKTGSVLGTKPQPKLKLTLIAFVQTHSKRSRQHGKSLPRVEPGSLKMGRIKCQACAGRTTPATSSSPPLVARWPSACTSDLAALTAALSSILVTADRTTSYVPKEKRAIGTTLRQAGATPL